MGIRGDDSLHWLLM